MAFAMYIEEWKAEGDPILAKDKKTLEEIRRQIDDLDAELQALLARRMENMAALREMKQRAGRESVYRPWREAQIFRQRMDAPQGLMPLAALLRIWQEICAAAGSLQMGQAMEIALSAPPEEPAYRDLARAQCGAEGVIKNYDDAASALGSFKNNPHQVALLAGGKPARKKGARAWWQDLKPPFQIVARLPFLPQNAAEETAPFLYVIMQQPWKPSGHDRTLLCLEGNALKKSAPETIRKALLALSWEGDILEEEGGACLLSLRGYVGEEDSRLRQLGDTLGASLNVLGGYGIPKEGSGR